MKSKKLKKGHKVQLISVWELFEHLGGRKFTKKEKEDIQHQMRGELDFDRLTKKWVKKVRKGKK